MIATTFIDTNVLVYAASHAAADQEKRVRARELLCQPDIAFSAQVLQEFYVAAVTKKKLEMTHDEAVAVLQSLRAFPLQSITPEVVLDATAAKVRFGISYWDAAILTAAKHLGCKTVLSEDLNPGQDYDGVRVLNPFAA